ncbi:hypothetical protein BJ742DRAFT_703938 [Cladochytrium replicatum]|nr:hypothetical protein BJ742DRAFT_703938 [Cladochytrium replicatum]
MSGPVITQYPRYIQPDYYAYTLVQERACPGLSDKDCKYLQTAQGDVSDQNGIAWNCTAGNYCQSPIDSPHACTQGFYCPENSAQPIYCPAKYYCPTPSQVLPCPANNYCPVGSVAPLRCVFLAYCPEKTDSAPKFGIFVIFAVFSVVVWIIFSLVDRHRSIRNLKHLFRLEVVKRESEDSGKAKAHPEGSADDPEDPKSSTLMGLSRVQRPFDLKFQNLGVMLPSGVEIMRSVSGELRGGRLCAIMGPSGAGKTTFLTVLTGKAIQGKVSGTVWVNGKKSNLFPFKKLVGFVPQEDILLRELTVYNNLLHSARMRLPANLKTEEIKEKVTKMVRFLQLDGVIDSEIGDETQRGISGGQRKRVNIGMELVAEPSVLFLDEPTSGLDSSTAYEVCRMLKNAAHQQGMVIASVIHSPSPKTFQQFDDLLLLGKGGRVVYFGPRAEAAIYFDRLGFMMPAGESPSDFYMDIVSGHVKNIHDDEFEVSDLCEYWEQYEAGHNIFANIRPEGTFKPNDSAGTFNPRDSLLKNDQSSAVEEKIHHEHNDHEEHEPLTWAEFKRTHHSGGGYGRAEEKKGFAGFMDAMGKIIADIFANVGWYLMDILIEMYTSTVGFFRWITFQRDPVRQTPNVFVQGYLCFLRAAMQVYRRSSAFLFEQILHLGCGAFISIAVQKFTSLGNLPLSVCISAPYVMRWRCWNPEDDLRQAGMFVALGVYFAGQNVAAGTFGKERVVYWRDRAAGLHAMPYFLAKALVDLPRVVIAATMYSAALALFFPYRQRWELLLLNVMTLYLSAFGMGYVLSILCRPNQVALATTGFCLLWALVFSGVMPDLSDVMDNYGIFQYVWWASAPRWSVEAFWLLEIDARPWEENKTKKIGEEIRFKYKFGNFYNCIAYMSLIGVSWYLVAYLCLKLVDRRKQK